MVHLGFLDSLLILLYAAAVVFIGFRAARRSSASSEDYLLAGRTLTLPMFVASLVSTWYGGILGIGEFSYRYGISNWVVMGVPYYVFALIFALFLARRIRASNLVTIPDQLEAAYGRRTALLGGVLTFLLATPAAYVLMLGILVQLIFGLDLTPGILLTTFVTLVYLFAGGFRSGVWANMFQFVLMFLGFAVMVGFAYAEFGGPEFIRANVPALHLTWHGGNSLQYIAVWFFIALWTLVDPAFYQRCYAAKDGTTAQRGIVVSVLFWFVFDLLTTTTGLYARAVLPDLAQPAQSYPLLAERTLPVVAKGLFYVGLLATIMSTLSSLSFVSATAVGKDIVGRFMRAPEGDRLVQRWTRIGLIISGVFSVALALAVPSVVKIWYAIGTAIIPGLLVPVVSSYSERLRVGPQAAFWSMLLGWGVSTASLLYGQANMTPEGPSYWLGIEPMYPGLAVALAVWGVGRMNGGAHPERGSAREAGQRGESTSS